MTELTQQAQDIFDSGRMVMLNNIPSHTTYEEIKRFIVSLSGCAVKNIQRSLRKRTALVELLDGRDAEVLIRRLDGKHLAKAKLRVHLCHYETMLVITGLPLTTTLDEFNSTMSQYGKIQRSFLMPGVDGKAVGLGFVQFAHNRDKTLETRTSLNLREIRFGSQSVRVYCELLGPPCRTFSMLYSKVLLLEQAILTDESSLRQICSRFEDPVFVQLVGSGKSQNYAVAEFSSPVACHMAQEHLRHVRTARGRVLPWVPGYSGSELAVTIRQTWLPLEVSLPMFDTQTLSGIKAWWRCVIDSGMLQRCVETCTQSGAKTPPDQQITLLVGLYALHQMAKDSGTHSILDVDGVPLRQLLTASQAESVCGSQLQPAPTVSGVQSVGHVTQRTGSITPVHTGRQLRSRSRDHSGHHRESSKGKREASKEQVSRVTFNPQEPPPLPPLHLPPPNMIASTPATFVKPEPVSATKLRRRSSLHKYLRLSRPTSRGASLNRSQTRDKHSSDSGDTSGKENSAPLRRSPRLADRASAGSCSSGASPVTTGIAAVATNPPANTEPCAEVHRLIQNPFQMPFPFGVGNNVIDPLPRLEPEGGMLGWKDPTLANMITFSGHTSVQGGERNEPLAAVELNNSRSEQISSENSGRRPRKRSSTSSLQALAMSCAQAGLTDSFSAEFEATKKTRVNSIFADGN